MVIQPHRVLAEPAEIIRGNDLNSITQFSGPEQGRGRDLRGETTEGLQVCEGGRLPVIASSRLALQRG